jgi:hypothetical protein
MDHGGAGGNCSTCHPNGGSNYTCYNCHDRAETEKHHAEKNILDIANRCTQCHAGGRGD